MKQDYVIHAGKGLKESFDLGAKKGSIDKMKDTRLFNIKNTDEWSEEYTATEGGDGVEQLSELGTPPVMDLTEGRKVIFTPGRWGGSIVFTEADWLKRKDNTTKIREFLIEKRNTLMVNMKYKFVNDIFRMYNGAFDTTLAPDAVTLCGAHVDVDDNPWFDNSSTQEMGLSAIQALDKYAGELTDPTAKEQSDIDFDTIIVKKGGNAAVEAKKLLAGNIAPTKVGDVNIYDGTKTIIETAMIKDTDNWFALASNHHLGNPLYVGVNQAPKMHNPFPEKNISVTYSATAFWKTGVNKAPLTLFGSTGKTA